MKKYLIVVGLFFVSVVIMIVFSPKLKPKDNPIRIDEIELDTGDLIFLRGKTIKERAVCSLTGCPVSHIGMIVRDENGVYVWEADLGQGYKPGARLIPLKEKLDRYKGDKIGVIKKLNTDRPPILENVKDIIYEHLEKEMDLTFVSYLTSKLPNSFLYYFTSREGKIFCSELVADTYQKLALMKADHLPNSYSPTQFYEGDVPLVDGVSLGENIYFSF